MANIDRLTNRQFLLRKLQILLSGFQVPLVTDAATLMELERLHQVTGQLIEAFSRPSQAQSSDYLQGEPERDFINTWIANPSKSSLSAPAELKRGGILARPRHWRDGYTRTVLDIHAFAKEMSGDNELPIFDPTVPTNEG